jgi:uncharacterized protein YeaO (DUF488 family)
MLTTKRAYETPERADGHRVLVERLWPRGLKKTDAHFDQWLKDVAPSDDLRKWFGHDPERWVEFKKRYEHDLRAAGPARDAVTALLDQARSGNLTLVYAAKDEEHNSALVLKKEIERRLRR